MLKPIPARILRQAVTLKICTGTDAWKAKSYRDVPLSRVCVQSGSRTRRTSDNTEVTLQAVCFADARLSRPAGIDIAALKDESEQAGGEMLLVFAGRTYTVLSVDTLRDDTGRIHHYEIGVK